MATFKFENKYACAAYFNLARDNFHRTMMDVLKKIGIDKNYTETDLDAKLAEMLDVLKGNLTAMDNQEDVKKLTDQQTRLRQMLFRSFPILGPVSTEIIKKRHRERFKESWENLSAEEQEAINNTKDENEKRKKKNALVDDDGDRESTCLDCFEAIYTIGCCLTDCRNYFTHYKPYNTPEKLKEKYERQKQVAAWLSNVFTASRRLDKKRNKLSSAEMEFITNYAYKIKTDENGKKVTDEDGHDIFVQNHDYYFSILGESFIAQTDDYNFLQKDYDNEDLPFGNPDYFAFSDFGLLYLCCCFVSRLQANEFIKVVSLFKDSPENMKDNDFEYVLKVSAEPSPNMVQKEELARLKKKLRIESLDLTKQDDQRKFNELRTNPEYWQQSPENEIIKEMLSIYRIRLPKGNRLDKQDNATTVALDILNELCRCPRPVYDVLTPKGQKAFEDTIDKETGGTPATVDGIRYTDRFPYLALRAIDEANLLPDIRFQIQLGYYRFAFYDKHCIDGKSMLRRLGKTVNGFGKLSAIEAKRKLDWSPEEEDGDSQVPNKFQRKIYAKTQLEDGKTELDLLRPVEDVVGNEPYITDSAAFYNIHNNRIGLYWEKKKESNKLNSDDVLVFPTLSASPNGEGGHRKNKVAQQSPLCSLSVRDLPALLFLCYLYNHSGSIAENVIIKKYDGLKKFFTDLSRKPSEENKAPTLETIQNEISKRGLEAVLEKNYGLKPTEIPQRIKDYLDVETSNPHNDSIDVIAYFRERLTGTQYELPAETTIDLIKELINKWGVEAFNKRHAGTPARLRPKLTQDEIVRNGLDRVLEVQKRYDEEVPAAILALFSDEVDVTDEKEHKETKPDRRASDFIEILLGNDKDRNNPNIGRIERRIKQIDSHLRKLKDSKDVQFDKSNRYGTKSYKDVRYGRLAEILAESVIKWQPSQDKGKDKLTGLNYRRMVDFLATYNPLSSIDGITGIEALRNLFSHRDARLLGSSNAHPFLHTVLDKNPRNIEELFQFYMQQEKNTLISIKEKIRKLDNPTIEDLQAIAPAFVHPQREKWSLDTRDKEQFRQMAANYVKPGSTLLLPDGLFTDAIISRLDIAERNVSYLISKYLETLHDHCQSFYEADTELFYRDYDLLCKLGEKPLSRVRIAELIQGQEARNKLAERIANKFKADAKENVIRKISQIRKNEKAILRFKTQDIVLFLTAKKMLQSQQTVQDGAVNTDERIHRTNLGRLTSRAIDRRMAIQQERQERVEKMRLQDIFDGDALNITTDYEYKFRLEWQVFDEQGNGVFKEGKKGSKIPVTARRIIYLTQENVTFKNFGRIYRILNDPRLKILLTLLVEKREGGRTQEAGPAYTVSVAELANEFAKFDSLRPQAFVFIHHLEKTAHPRLSNPESDETYQFKNMMRLLCEEKEADAVNQLRVSFAHSIYGIDADLFGKQSTLQVPLVSELMEKQMQSRAEDIIKRTKEK